MPLGVHIQEVEVSRKGWGGFSNWGCKCCHMEHLFAACFGPPHLHPQNKGLDMVLLGGQWTGS